LRACDRLNASGIAQYEISNFARAGFESRHNLKYWTRQPYLGFGVDAHSMLLASADSYSVLGADDRNAHSAGGSSPCALSGSDLEAVRFSTADALEAYVSGAPLMRTPVPRRAAFEENFFLGLRLTAGVDLRRAEAEFGPHMVEALASEIDHLVRGGLMLRQGNVVALTPRGTLISNEIFQRFLSVPHPA
jgi:oxygen-independent coproporphyrinogen-3 oxidase